jgi:ankyrin repeat protein
MTAQDVLKRYLDEGLPEFDGLPLTQINQPGRFGNSPLHVACTRGSEEEVSALLAGGAAVNALGELENRPLHDAIGQGHTQVARLLLQAGADREAINAFGDSPRSLAEKLGHTAIIRLIDGCNGDL